MKRYLKHGHVAVIYSNNYGAGWSTWNYKQTEWCLFDIEMAKWIEQGRVGNAPIPDEIRKDLFIYDEDVLKGLCIEWIPVGKKFRVYEYDGKESILFTDETWYVA